MVAGGCVQSPQGVIQHVRLAEGLSLSRSSLPPTLGGIYLLATIPDYFCTGDIWNNFGLDCGLALFFLYFSFLF